MLGSSVPKFPGCYGNPAAKVSFCSETNSIGQFENKELSKVTVFELPSGQYVPKNKHDAGMYKAT